MSYWASVFNPDLRKEFFNAVKQYKLQKMAKMYFASIDVTKIDKSKLYKGQKGTYLNLTIFIDVKEDEYGHSLHIQQSTKKGEERIYLGDGKESTHINK